MVTNLRSAVAKVAQNSLSLNNASSQLAAAASQAEQATSQIAITIQQVAGGITQQTNSVTQTASSVNEMERAIEGCRKDHKNKPMLLQKHLPLPVKLVLLSTGSCQHSNRSGRLEKRSLTAIHGSQTVSETIHEMESIRSKVSFSAQKVQEMGSRSEQIGIIIETINDIASQTNFISIECSHRGCSSW
jgi:methyl-accepting chemotaxis protein